MKEVKGTVLDEQALNDILNGAAFYGSGGGGPIAAGKEIIGQILASKNPLVLVAAEDVPDDAYMAVSAFAGSPDAATQSTLNFGAVASTAYDALAKINGKDFTHVIAPEVGAGNTFIPMAVAVTKNIPVADASNSPRAVPEMQMGGFADGHVPVSPVILANPEQQLSLTVDTAAEADEITRAIISDSPSFSNLAGVAMWSMSGADMKKYGMLNGVTKAQKLGQFIRETAKSSDDPIQAIAEFTGATELFRGKITDVEEQIAGGFDVGQVRVTAANGDEYFVMNQNENMIAWKASDTKPLIISPDYICWVDETGQPFSNAELSEYTQKSNPKDNPTVALLGIKAEAPFNSDFVIQSFLDALRKMGYGGAYLPLGEL